MSVRILHPVIAVLSFIVNKSKEHESGWADLPASNMTSVVEDVTLSRPSPLADRQTDK